MSEFTTTEYQHVLDEALTSLTDTVEKQQIIIEALFNAVNEERRDAGKPELTWQHLLQQSE